VHCYRMLGSVQERRGRRAGHAAGRLAGPGRVRGARLGADGGSTGSPPTSASTRAARPAGAPPRSGTCRTSNRRSRPCSVRSSGSNRCPTPCSRGRPTARRPARAGESISLAFVTALAGAAAPPARRGDPARRARVPRGRGGRDAGHDRRVGHSALKRARAGLRRRLPAEADREPPPASRSPAEDAVVAKFRSRLGGAADVDALVDLFTDDVFPRDAADALRVRGPRARDPLLRQHLRRGPAVRPRPDASQRPSRRFGAYLRAPRRASATGWASTSSPSPATGFRAMTRFENTVLPSFGLPRSLPSR